MQHRNKFHGVRCKTIVLALACVAILTVVGCSSGFSAATKPRPGNWASPVIPQPSGLPNLYRVNSTLYRSAQPTMEGFLFLESRTSLAHADRPIKTIVSLRLFTPLRAGFAQDDSKLVPPVSGLRLEQIRFMTWHPEDEDVIKFLRIARTPALQPVLVHCHHGSDRTGTMVAIYRIAFEGWSKAQAIDEMIHGGFGFHPMWQNLISYIEALDVDTIKAQVNKQGAWQ